LLTAQPSPVGTIPVDIFTTRRNSVTGRQVVGAAEHKRGTAKVHDSDRSAVAANRR
jgi:hypothetical protein